MFATVLHNLKSPENAGIVVRTHVAFGGDELVVVGPEPWRFKKRVQAFSRRLERLCKIVHLPDDDAFFSWCHAQAFEPVAIEISDRAELLPHFRFPAAPAIVVGNERSGLSDDFIGRCHSVVTIPQFGPVECLNAAVSCCIAIYEFSRKRHRQLQIEGSKFVITGTGGSAEQSSSPRA